MTQKKINSGHSQKVKCLCHRQISLALKLIFANKSNWKCDEMYFYVNFHSQSSLTTLGELQSLCEPHSHKET